MSDNRLRDAILLPVLLILGALAFYPLWGNKIFGHQFNAIPGLYYPTYFVQIDPNNEEILKRRASYAFQGGEWQAALTDLNTILERSKFDMESLRMRAQAYEHLGDNKRALSDYTTVLMFSPTDDWMYLRRAVVYDNLGEHSLARIDRARANRYAGRSHHKRWRSRV